MRETVSADSHGAAWLFLGFIYIRGAMRLADNLGIARVGYGLNLLGLECSEALRLQPLALLLLVVGD